MKKRTRRLLNGKMERMLDVCITPEDSQSELQYLGFITAVPKRILVKIYLIKYMQRVVREYDR